MGNRAVTPWSVAISAARLWRILATSSSLRVNCSGDKLSNLGCIVASMLEKSDIIDGYGDAKEVKGVVWNTTCLKWERGRT